jgi:hypothetical protein
MKKLLLIICMLLCTGMAYAKEPWSIDTKVYKFIPSDSERVVQSGNGIQVNLGYKKVFLFGSKDDLSLRYGGQRGTDITLWGGGFGASADITPWLAVSCQIGWYQPKYDLQGKWVSFRDPERADKEGSHLSEGLAIELTQKLSNISSPCVTSPYDWYEYRVKHSGNIGGSIGLAIHKEIFKNFGIGLTCGYRYLRLEEMIKGRNPDMLELGWHEYKQERDFGGYTAGVRFTYRF